MGFLIRRPNDPDGIIHFVIGLPTYLGIMFIGLLFSPSLHWLYLLIIWIIFDFIFNEVYQHYYDKLVINKLAETKKIDNIFYIKAITIQIIAMFILFMICLPFF